MSFGDIDQDGSKKWRLSDWLPQLDSTHQRDAFPVPSKPPAIEVACRRLLKMELTRSDSVRAKV